LQGIHFIIRKIISNAPVTTVIKQYSAAPFPPFESTTEVTHVSVEQRVKGYSKGMIEPYCLDAQWRTHRDWLFGDVSGMAKWISKEELAGFIVAEHGEFLNNGWPEGESEKDGSGGEAHILIHVQNAGAGWSALMVWGFQNVSGERRHTRNIVIAKGKERVEFRLVYDFIAEE
jgi:hypothetical protein